MVIGLPIPKKLTAAYGYFGTAVALGSDRAEGLAFELVYADDPATTASALAQGRCDFAPLNTTMGLLSHERGLPMTAVYSKSRRTHRWFAVLPGSPIVSLVDLKGKRIACDFPELQPKAEAALAEEGEILRARLETLDPTGSSDPRWGVIERHEIVAWKDFLLGAGALRRRLDPEIYYTNVHVDRFNAFDERQVIEHAQRQRLEP